MDGQILIDGTDIKTLRLADLRRAISVLFQDYTLFPLSVRSFMVRSHRSPPSLKFADSRQHFPW